MLTASRSPPTTLVQRRRASRVVKVKALPFDLNTAALLRNAFSEQDITPTNIEPRQRPASPAPA